MSIKELENQIKLDRVVIQKQADIIDFLNIKIQELEHKLPKRNKNGKFSKNIKVLNLYKL